MERQIEREREQESKKRERDNLFQLTDNKSIKHFSFVYYEKDTYRILWFHRGVWPHQLTSRHDFIFISTFICITTLHTRWLRCCGHNGRSSAIHTKHYAYLPSYKNHQITWAATLSSHSMERQPHGHLIECRLTGSRYIVPRQITEQNINTKLNHLSAEWEYQQTQISNFLQQVRLNENQS